jgi:hypothetical protein
MCRGLGALQRACLDVLTTRRQHLDSIAIAAAVTGHNPVTLSEHASTRRALRKLAKAGAIVDMGRYWRMGRRHWGIPEVADEARRRALAMFGRCEW